MKPRIDITARNSFAIWESGSWNSREGLGRATIVAGAHGEKLSVIFDTSPAINTFHFLFFADVGNLVALAFVKTMHRQNQLSYLYDLELSRLQSLSIEKVQGNDVARAKMDTIWRLKETGDRNYSVLLDRTYTQDPTGRTLIEQAIEKAITPPVDQKLFWGIPRDTEK